MEDIAKSSRLRAEGWDDAVSISSFLKENQMRVMGEEEPKIAPSYV